MPEVADVMFMLGIAGLAMWRREIPLYVIASLVCFFVGARWFNMAWNVEKGWEYGVGAMGIAGFCIYRAVMQAFRGRIRG